MFARLGGFAARFRWAIIAAWVVAAVLLTFLAPNIDKVSVNDQRAFLPTSTPSLDAARVLKENFPDRFTASSAVVVIDAGAGNSVMAAGSWSFAQEITTFLTGPDTPAGVKRVMSPVTADEQTAKALVSSDGQIAMVVVTFEKGGAEVETAQALDVIKGRLASVPAGTTVYLTGDAAILHEYNAAARSSMNSTTWITILLVVLILLLVYRSPVSPAIPLLTIGLAYLISRGVVAILGNTVMTISGYTNIFLIVMLFGAGTDYCLFLISRFREEMAEAHKPSTAVRQTVRTVGETISSSAGTVVVGLATMGLAELGLFNTSGPSLAIGVVIALAAGLTLTPALLTILGDATFWPRKARHMKDGRVWGAWSGAVTRRPWLALLITVALLVPLAVYGLGMRQDFDLLADLSGKSSARQGFTVLSDHMGAGSMQPLTVVVKDEHGFTGPEGLAHLDRLQKQLSGVKDVALVRSLTSALAGGNTLSVPQQLTDQAKTLRAGLAQLQQLQQSGQSDPTAVQTAVTGLLDLYGYVRQLGAQFPEVQADTAYQKAMAAFTELAEAFGLSPAALALAGTVSAADLPALSLPSSGLPPAVSAALTDLADSFEALSGSFAGRPEAQMLPDSYVKNNEGLKALKAAYVSEDGTAARIQVTLGSGPYSRDSMTAVEDLRRLVAADGPGGAVEGSSAIITDLAGSSHRDMVRAIISVLIGIFVVLVLLLRALVAPVYLILTILLSYGATLGVVRLLFVDVLGAAGVTWWVPTFMFVMLVALGMDYNIFLMGRVKEEVRKSGNRAGVRTALAKTGGIITSAGIIMAGTFAAMLSADILGLVQIAFAVAFGVLLDTFVVRTSLVPAVCVLLDRWNWWPRKQA